MNHDDRTYPAGTDKDRDAEHTDETVPPAPTSDDEPQADELTRKIDEIERKVADGN